VALIIRGLWKAYNHQPALRGIDLDLECGVVALLGPNGSGKTTLLRILATILSPDQGGIVWRGYDYSEEMRLIRHQLAYLPQDLHLPEHLTPIKLMNYLAQLKGYGKDHQIYRLLEDLRLLPLADQSFSRLSGGQVRLTGVAQAFLGDPCLLLLDELTLGLDVQEREAVFRLVRRQSGDSLVIFSTHVPSDVECIAQELIVLNEGKVVYCGGIEGFRSRVDGMVYEVRLPVEEAPKLLESCCVSRMREDKQVTILRVVGDPPKGYPAVSVSGTLEDAYLYGLKGDCR
jgi:ABC-2 type transport system ATP-binding protein